MRAFLTLLSLLVILLHNAQAQYNSNDRIFRLIKKENFDKAIQYGNERIEMLKKKGHKKMLKKGVSTYMGLGLVYEKSGNFAESEKNYRLAEELVDEKKKEDKKLKIIDYDVDDEMAMLFLETGNFDEANDLLKNSVKTREERFSRTNLLRYRPYLAYGRYYYNTNRYDSAYYYLSRYILYIKNSNHNSKQDLNRFADAYELLARLEVKRDNLVSALHFAKKNKQYQFFRWTKKAAGRNNINKIKSLNLLADIYRLNGNTEKAIKYNQKAFELYDKEIKTESYYQIPLFFNRGMINWDLGKYKDAEQDFFKALNGQDKFIQQNFFALTEYEKENFYASIRLQSTYINAFAMDRASKGTLDNRDSLISKVYNHQISTKAIILSESNRMLEQIYTSKDTSLTNAYLEWRKLKNELITKMTVNAFNENDPQVKDIKHQINLVEKEMTQKTALFSQNEAKSNPDWQDIQQVLKADEAALEIIRVPVYGLKKLNPASKKDQAKLKGKSARMLTDSVAYFILSLDKKNTFNPSFTIIANGNQLEGRYYNYYQNTIKRFMEDTISYRAFWQPLNSITKGKKRIYVSADGVYNMINLSILKVPGTQNYIVDQTDIVNITNTKELLKKPETNIKPTTALLIGRPVYGSNSGQSQSIVRGIDDSFRSGISDLPGTEKEVKSISATLKKQNIKQEVLIGADAREENLKSSASKDIIHIATHGFFDANNTDKSPMLRSGLLLSGVTDSVKLNNEDGILTAYEASNLDLSKTELVVLSACETGKGEVKSGEGVYGLQRAFEVAGVRFVLMSMWTVSDQATVDLMGSFYAEFIKSNDVLKSFKDAEIKVRKTYPQPYYWGAFKLIGN